MPSRKARQPKRHRREKEMRRVRKQIKRNRKPKRPRRPNWMPDSFDNLDEIYEFPQSERIMPRGERERRRTVVAETLVALEKETDAYELNVTEARDVG